MPGPHSFRQILSTNGRMPEVLLVPDMKLFAGNATPELAQRIANRLYTSLGDAAVGRFSDGEVSVQINENVRGGDIFIIQSTCAPTNDNLMELVVMVDALRRASAGRITGCYPLLWLCAPGPSRPFRSCTNHCESGCRLPLQRRC
ncbi:ribose-phosphate pyrophosphokinase [Escherichia coli]|uniref:Ribose-phosphate pyrophosphokinase n=1 Tax=Escherichia coli TaxID=562 RepID=A0A376KX93_ECOLX|nr:ribose-phosphate pyrophosphokinase [Escherichia coli]